MSLHVFMSWLEPSQDSPPFALAGLSQILIRVFSATPQVLLQGAHAPQTPQTPSTDTQKTINH